MVGERDKPEKMFTLTEVAAACGVGEDTVKVWVKQGKLKAVVLGHSVVRVTAEEYKRFIQEW